MLYVDIPTLPEFRALAARRADACVSLYLPTTPVSQETAASRIELKSDYCTIDKDCFIRGVIEIPIHDYDQRFGFGVWVSQKPQNLQTYLANFDSAEIGPFFGWLSTRIAYYAEDTLHLKTMAHFRGGNLRPFIELEPTNHPLAIAQRTGITLAKAWEIVHFYEERQ